MDDLITRFLDGDDNAWRDIPVSVRAAFASALLVAADQPINGVQLAHAGNFSRSTALRAGTTTRTVIDALIDHPTRVYDTMTRTWEPREVTRDRETDAEIRRAHERIAELRERNCQLAAEIAPLRQAVQALAEELRAYRPPDTSPKVRHPHPVGSPSDSHQPPSSMTDNPGRDD